MQELVLKDKHAGRIQFLCSKLCKRPTKGFYIKSKKFHGNIEECF